MAKKNFKRHCEEVYTDLEETKDVQEERIEYFKKKGNQQLTEEGHNAEITVDLVLQARAKLSDNKVNGPVDVIVSEMIIRLPIHGPDGIPKLMEGCETRLFEEVG